MMETPPIATKAEERLFDSMARIWGNASNVDFMEAPIRDGRRRKWV